MPCYLFTFHAYGTWLPDRRRGYVRRDKQGIHKQDHELADKYKEQMSQDIVRFDRDIQELMIDVHEGKGSRVVTTPAGSLIRTLNENVRVYQTEPHRSPGALERNCQPRYLELTGYPTLLIDSSRSVTPCMPHKDKAST